jgi:hypothetical protein
MPLKLAGLENFPTYFLFLFLFSLNNLKFVVYLDLARRKNEKNVINLCEIDRKVYI